MGASERTASEMLPRWRFGVVVAAFALLAGALLWRAVDLQVLRNDFLRNQGDARYLREVADPAHRGTITDRNGEPLAISTPVASVWAHPGKLLEHRDRLSELAAILDRDTPGLTGYLQDRSEREFVYLERHVRPATATAVQDLDLPGVALEQEFQRFYPAGEVTAHVLGFTDVDDVGLAGLELAYDSWLQGEPGRERVLQDRHGRVVDTVERIRDPQPGRELRLTIDRRLQYLAYRQIKTAVARHEARGGAIVLMDPDTGAILAMANQPAFNPNDRSSFTQHNQRNAAVVDAWEPGSVLKPFTVAAALEAGEVTPETELDTAPGVFRVGGHPIRDLRDYGRIDVATVIKKSSNIGAAKLALNTEPPALWNMLNRAGLGQRTGLGFPGEADGSLPRRPPDGAIERATMGFGYGVAVTPLQLTRAYAALATDGRMPVPTVVAGEMDAARERVMSAETAEQVRSMLEAATATGGTGTRAQVPGYRVAGKTGTVHKSVDGGYAEDRYVAWFAGMAPASDPELVMAIMLEEPSGEAYYGGQVAAPVFAEVMGGALRLLNVPPDGLEAPAPSGVLTAMGEEDP